ncbi:372_t:CDS:10 [Acaulospora colombiana]|uniref:372_t:CDS:1 n=1 Tax=Acaulospora colombiana TaxID=27376 RepID=A0ACA9LD42_9GLOM|nr:372_t:CDS:10 [Acaulospora colombiana]
MSRSKTITLEDWESKTQLTETQKQSAVELQDACAELPLPDGFLGDFGSGTPQRTSSPTAMSMKDANLLLAEFQASDAATSASDATLGIPQPIETTQQFFDWFSKMENDMEKDQEDVYRQSCDAFLEQIDNTVRLFSDLDGNFKFVEERTKALQTACEKLLDEQNNLTTLADAMSSKLAYYNELEPITKSFNSPGDDICEQEDFIPMLAKLDECLEYMQSNQLDLDYPNKLKNSGTNVQISSVESTETKELHPSPLPESTVQKDNGDSESMPPIFDDIAQDAVQLCLQSLLSASEAITRESKIDGQLFLIKHLLILKEQIASFDTQFIHEEKDLDFSSMTDAISEMLHNKYTIFSPTKLLGLATKGIPKVVENRIDAKQEVDKELKHICEEFILDNSKAAIEPLSSFLLKVSTFRLRNDLREVHRQTSLKNQNFAQPDKIIEVYETFQETVKNRLRYIIPKMSEYLGDRETESILLKPMQKHIIDTYQAFYDIMQNENFEFGNFQKSLGDIDKVKEWVQCDLFWEEQNGDNHTD